jgi:hypothetical protein
MEGYQAYHSFYNQDDSKRWSRQEMSKQLAVTMRWFGSDR